jgi:hypothetical protein
MVYPEFQFLRLTTEIFSVIVEGDRLDERVDIHSNSGL